MWRFLRTRRGQLGLAIVVALVVVALWPHAVEVDVAIITRGPLLVTVDEEGETRVRDKFVVTAPVAGEVQRIELEPGDAVVGGRTVVARIRPAAPAPLDARTRAELDAAIRAAEAVVARANAERDRLASAALLAAQLRDRARRLLTGGAIASEELEVREADARATADALRGGEFAVTQAKHDLDAARARLSWTTTNRLEPERVIVAPVSGVVLKRLQESAQVVLPGAPLLEIGDPQNLEVVADLLSAEAVQIAPGAEVVLEQWGGAQVLAGRVRRVEPSAFTKISALGVEEQRVNVVIDLQGLEDAGVPIGDGYRAEVRIVTWKASDVLLVPIGALFRDRGGWAVFAIEGGRARQCPVSVGHRTSAVAEVLAGLSAGDRVVLYAPDTLTDGARVSSRPR